METEIIDKLFLEFSQITTAKTKKEINLEAICHQLFLACEMAKEELPRACRCPDRSRSCPACMALNECEAALDAAKKAK